MSSRNMPAEQIDHGKKCIVMVAACPFPYPRGTPARIFRMSEALANRGHDVHVVTYHLGEQLEQMPFTVHRILDIKTYRRVMPGPNYQKLLLVDPVLAITLRRILKKLSVDIIHAHHYEGLVVAAWARRGFGIPLIYDAHTLLHSELPSYSMGLSTRLKQRAGSVFDKKLPAWADHIISVSDEIRDSLVSHSGIPAERITVIVNGVENELFSNQSPFVRADSGAIVVFAGNLATYQGIDLLLKAFQKVVQSNNNIILRFLTESDFTPYEKLCKTLGIYQNIEIVPTSFKDLPMQLAQANVMVNPRPDCTGIPQKLLNYMAAAKAIVSFAGSAKHLEHEQTALIIENGNTVAFADAILRLTGDQEFAQKLGQNAYQKSLDFSWERNAINAEMVYESLSL